MVPGDRNFNLKIWNTCIKKKCKSKTEKINKINKTNKVENKNIK